ncbi:MAG: glycoside hydrolase family 3 N-terminal domain-containing protein [Candidatus Sumerlaeia bacterium]
MHEFCTKTVTIRFAALAGLLLCFRLNGFTEDLNCDIGRSPVDIVLGIELPPAGAVATSDAPAQGPPLRQPDMAWVDSSLAAMTLEEKIGQLIVSSQHSNGTTLIDQYKLGGFVFLGNNQDAAAIVSRTNELQNYSPFPLWFSIDAEAGLGARVANASIFPLIMALGAANDPTLTAECGRITARECRSLGVQVAYAPVLDVNTEPLNPIISTRSFGDRPDLVAQLGQAFTSGAHEEGLLCTFKHYPGHGATTGDSHNSLPLVDVGVETMYAVHIRPYSLLAPQDDVDLVMTAHVWYSAFYPDAPWPATLGPIFLKDILRDEIGFKGLITSDSYDMAGLTTAIPDPGERAVVGLEAGLDIILNPSNVGAVFTGIRDAVLGGRLTEARLNESVRRVLIAKSRVGLPENRTVDPNLWPTVLNHPQHQAVVRAVCEKAFTCVKNDLTTSPPVKASDKVLLLTLTSTTTIFYLKPSSFFTNPMMAGAPNTTVRSVPRSVSSSLRNDIVAQASGMDVVVVAGYDWYRIAQNSQVTLIKALAALNVPVIYVSFGAPYHFLQIPEVDAFYCGYASPQPMQEVAAEVLLGRRKAVGILPVYLSGIDRGNTWLAR